MRQLPLAFGPRPPQTFDSYLARANAPAVAHLQALSLPAAPVYLWGPAGSGKTHLLHALILAAQERGERAGWFSAQAPLPFEFDDTWSLIVIDDADALDAPRQHGAFTLFVEAMTHGVQLVAAGRMPPVDLPVRDDLRTRLGWGHVFALQPLGESEARAVLRREADRRGIFLSDEVMDYVLSRFSRDLKNLMGLLDRLDDFALAEQRAVTVPLLKLMLAHERPLAAAEGGQA
ncbi:DnaA regulatory inactivator Hda [Aquincola sp. MAHUQ-54]|uniref:DnaA regulatory inactivator Hda n=1 Tax=Aquincola agrisoli TaxID=3119538 RepID=A0AAW9QCI4_9BURK